MPRTCGLLVECVQVRGKSKGDAKKRTAGSFAGLFSSAMNSSKANSREYQRRAIDAEIKSLEDSIRALKHRRNALAPISSLPTEVIAAIFSILRLFDAPLACGGRDHLAWLRVAHVCHQWREIALNTPRFWSHIDFTNITLAGATEMLVRAKKAPLHLKAWVASGDHARFNAFKKELPSRVTDICHLEIHAEPSFLRRTLKRLASPAPTLEYLSLTTHAVYPCRESRASIPDTLFGGAAPRLSFLNLHRCNISWKSPLLKSLRCLEISAPSKHVRPSLVDWLDALDDMQQLKKLILHSASPIAPPFPGDMERNVTLPFLTHLDISASAGECALALSHLVLPVLTELCIQAKSVLLGGGDVLKLLPYVAQHSHGSQDTQPLQNVAIRGGRNPIEILAYPDTNVSLHHLHFFSAVASTAPRVALYITCRFTTEILGAAMTALPLDNLLKLTIELYRARLDEEFWRNHAPRWPLLESMRLAPHPARVFAEMILEDDGGQENTLLPSLKNLALSESTLTVPRALRLRDALMMRVDQGVPLETLDLRSCYATNCADYSVAVELLSEIVVYVWAREAPCPGYFIPSEESEVDYSDGDNVGELQSSDDDRGEDDEEIDDDDDEEEDYEAGRSRSNVIYNDDPLTIPPQF
jgi:hypothetical protein